jgi:hypothetical protein
MQEENLVISLWDRTSPINGVSADEILSYRQDIVNEPVVLLFSDPNTGNVNQIQFPHTLVDILNTHDSFKPVSETDPIAIGHLYLQYLYLINHPETQKTEIQVLQGSILSIEDALFTILLQIDEINTKINGGA